MAQGALNKKQTLFASKLDVNLRKELVNCYILGIAATWTFRKVDQNTWKVLKCGAGKYGEDHLDRSCEK